MTLKLKHFGIFVLAVAPPIVAGAMTCDIAHNALIAFIPAILLAQLWTCPMENAYRNGAFDLYL